MSSYDDRFNNHPGVEGLWAKDPRVTADDEWADGYHRAQTEWTGMRPEDYPAPADEAGDDAA